MNKSLLIFLIFYGVSLFAGDEEMYRKGLDLATEKHVFETVNPSGTILDYQGTTLEESRYLEGVSRLSEDAKQALYKEGETPGSLLLEVTQDKPHFKMDDNDPLIKNANEIAQNPEATIHAEIEVNEEQDSLKKTLHVCVEGGDPYIATCTRDLAVRIAQKYKEYLNTTIQGVMFKRYHVTGNPQHTCKPLMHYGHDGRYNLTVKDETIPESTWRYFDGCNPYPHTVIKHYNFFKGFKGEVQTPITQEEYESKTLSPSDIREQWVSHCDALEVLVDKGQCTYAEKKCVDHPRVGGPGTRLIDGYPVFKQCWQEQLTYRCEKPVQNTCTPLRLKGCSQVSSKCLEKQGNACVLYEQTFECVTQQAPKKRISIKRGTLPFCLDGSCSTFGYAPNQDMAEALTKLAIFKDMQGQIEAKANSIFKGEAKSCSRNCVNFKDCCASGKGWGVSLGLSNCTEEEKALAQFREEKKCVFVGTYCSEKALGVCLKKKSTYCCFGSRLARLLHDQGRAQLGLNYGHAENPQCRGFTLEELQKIKFDNLNMSELYEDLQTEKVLPAISKVTQELSSNWQSKVSNIKEEHTDPSQNLNHKGGSDVVF
ncbi:MAG: conjugal transfer protein TraN [Caedimonadaceae bacterium]|nr:MAG: conjugal transfer protein TraN [Caedimonadaceae bacterium]